LVAAAVGAALLSNGDDEPSRLLPADHVGAVNPATGRLVAAVRVAGRPERLAARGTALWTLGTGSRTLSVLDVRDVRRSPVADVVAPGGTPSDVVAGAGGVWVLDAVRRRLSQVSAGYGDVVRSVPLPRSRPTAFSRDTNPVDPWAVAVGHGALWVTDGSRHLMRVDPRRRQVERLDLGRPLNGVAVDRDAVWAISGPRATALRIDPLRSKATVAVPIASEPDLESPYPIAIEAGFDALWVLNANTATVTGIDPRLGSTTIPLGIEHAPVRLAVGGGAVWVANADGTLSRIDRAGGRPRTLAVGHGLTDVAVAGGLVWVSAGRGSGAPLQDPPETAASGGGPSMRALPTSKCSALYYRPGDRPRLLIASELPLVGYLRAQGVQMTQAIQFVLRERGFRAGPHPIAYQACNDTPPGAITEVEARCAADAAGYAGNRSLVGLIGPLLSTCAGIQLPLLNGADGGPVPVISASNTLPGLTRDRARFAPSGRRSYVRVIAPDDVQAAADALLARQLGVRRVYVLDDGGAYYGNPLAFYFRSAATRLGLRIAGSATWGDAPGLVRRIRASRPDAVFLSAYIIPTGRRMLAALRRNLPAHVKIIAPDAFLTPELLRGSGHAAEGLFVSIAGQRPERLTGRGAAFRARFRKEIGTEPDAYAINAAQATEILLDAIARSDRTRASVVRELFTTRVRDGILGDFTFTPEGDITARSITIYRVTNGKIRIWKVIEPPAGTP
jgi:branched-chain amino acid transport system substrate-binding protein